MQFSSSDNKKNILSIIFIIIAFGAIFYVLGNKYGLLGFGNSTSNSLNIPFGGTNTNRINEIKAKSSSLKEINAEIFKSDNFKKLVKPPIEDINPAKIKPGNSKPFKQ